MKWIINSISIYNVGNVDIVNGNVKLILGLIWSLIVRYQIGRSKFPPRKLMLAWLQAALPKCKINNLTTDWNSGVNLSALLDYCQPGLFPHWNSLDANQSVRNCTNAMNIAQREFGVPKVLEPEYLASPWLDELSGMTYLSYFMKPGGPGYNATMRWANTQLKHEVNNFTVSALFNTNLNFFELFFDLEYFLWIRPIGMMVGHFLKLSKALAVPHQHQKHWTLIIHIGKVMSKRPLTPENVWVCNQFYHQKIWQIQMLSI